MHIHKQLTLEVDLRMCARIINQESSIKKEVTRQVYLQLFEIILTDVCAVSRKISDIAICIL